jgi:hypothetical protein
MNRPEETKLHSLAYFSHATRGMDKAALSGLLLKAQRFNESVGVTGLLIFANNRFLQTLEGSAPALADVYERIVRDPQHSDITMLFNDVVSTRVYPAWATSSIEAASSTIATFLTERLSKTTDTLTPSQRDAMSKSLDFIDTSGFATWLINR